MADVNGNKLVAGDIVEVVNMDDPVYRFLVGVRGVIEQIPPDLEDEQAIIVLQSEAVPGLSTHQSWVKKVE